jgi:catechol 2,3-dioxygenase-like lactoylglutathione lyase family enzyme
MNHLHINVPNVAEAQSFFEMYFDFRRVYPGAQRVFLMDPNGFLLALDQYEPGEDPMFPEWFHFGMCKSDPEWARNLYKRMESDGIEMFGALGNSDRILLPQSRWLQNRSPRKQAVNHVSAASPNHS